MKIVKKVILITIIVCVVFIIEEAVRIRILYNKNTRLSAPAIVLSYEDNTECTRGKCTSLGYSVTYYYNPTFHSPDCVTMETYGAEFRLFDKILIWAVIE